MDKDSRILVLGHRGLVGSAIVRALQNQGYKDILTFTREEYDLLDRWDVLHLFQHEYPDYVFLAAAKVGGIMANSTQKADFMYDNLIIQTNVIDVAQSHGVKKLLFLGSSCIYPKHSVVPIQEWQLMTGPLEPTNDAYAVAKIAGIKMCQAYREQHGFNAISLMPTNLYGINDNFDENTSHVLPALIRRFHEAKIKRLPEVVCWGTGKPMREFLHVDDLADACIFLMNNYDSGDIINVGTGEDISIRELSLLVAKIVGYEGTILWDMTKPDGTARKVLDVSKINDLGWKAQTKLEDGIRSTYKWYLDEAEKRNQITL